MMKVTIKQKIEIEQVAGTVWHKGKNWFSSIVFYVSQLSIIHVWNP